MEILVRREWETEESTAGRLFINGTFECFTLEPHLTNPIHAGHPAIPEGVYVCRVTKSPHLGYETPELLEVPGRSDIRVHIANWAKQLLGCTAVGEGYHEDMLTFSSLAFHSLMRQIRAALEAKETVRFTYVNDFSYGS